MANVLMKRNFSGFFLKLKNCADLQAHCLYRTTTNLLVIQTSRKQNVQTNYQHGHLLKSRFLYSNGNPWENCRFLHNSNINYYSSENNKKDDDQKEQPKKLSLLKKFKEMYKQYWYVLLPVHMVTSAFWFGGFFYLAKSGVDIQTILEYLHINEKVKTINNNYSGMGYLAVAFALYKIATPARYAVTLAGTTVAINYLRKYGYIKPIPSKERLKELYHEKKDNLMHGIKSTSDKMKKL